MAQFEKQTCYLENFELFVVLGAIFKQLQVKPVKRYFTFHEQQKYGYSFPSLPLAMRASADMSE